MNIHVILWDDVNIGHVEFYYFYLLMYLLVRLDVHQDHTEPQRQ